MRPNEDFMGEDYATPREGDISGSRIILFSISSSRDGSVLVAEQALLFASVLVYRLLAAGT